VSREYGPRRIHITGGAGSGKTTLAGRISHELGIKHHDLDGLALKRLGEAEDPGDAAGLVARLAAEVEAIAPSEAWVTDGSYATWVQPLFEHADVIVWLDVPWRVAAFRIPVRHAKAELAGSNRFPGWRRMVRFWFFSRRFYRDTGGEGVNEFGNPRTRSHLAATLRLYEHKLVICRSNADTQSLVKRLRG
jgi:adenylate kinase family enzyme